MELPGLFGDWLKARRKTLDLTQEELAGRIGCSIFTLRKIESGERRPSKQLAALLADGLDIPGQDRLTFVRVARGDLSPERLSVSRTEPQPHIPSSPQPAVYSLPLPPTPLLGREAELAALKRLFTEPQCRLLTLTGMGGIGKTRLAIEFASHWGSLFPDGVCYVPLAPINSADSFVPTIAEALGFSFSGPFDPMEQLLDHLRARARQSLLLVLDNFEHLLAPPSPAVGLVAELLKRVPCLKILTTSRERLNLQGEWMYELHGLPVPPSELSAKLDEYSAAVLFIQSARRVRIDFEVLEDEKPALVRICQLLEGIPLAIELAAAWVVMLTCTEIAREIEASMGFLETKMHDVPERHRSLRASFEYSWRLMSDPERQALSRLAIFRGGFDRLAAEQVVGATLPLLASLVSKSLVRRGEDGRYDLHEVIRQLALPHLSDDPGEHDAARAAHSAYYLKFAAEREEALRSAAQQLAARQLLHEMDNLRAAWVWAIHHADFALLGASVRSLGWFFEVTGLIREGIEQLEPLVRVLKSKDQNSKWRWVLGQTLTHQGMLYFRRGILDQARALMEESLVILRGLARQDLLMDVLVYLGIVLHLEGDIERSQLLLQEGLSYAQAVGDDWFLAYAIYNLGYIASLMGRYEDAYSQMQEGMAIWHRLGDPHSIALGLNYLAPALVKLGRLAAAELNLEKSLQLCRQSGNRWGIGTAYRYLGLVKMAEGKLDEAKTLLQTSIETFGDYVIGWDIAKSSIYLAEAIRLAGDAAQAQRVYVEALDLARQAQSIPLRLEALAGVAQLFLEMGNHERAFEISSFVLDQPSGTYETRDRAARIQRLARTCLDAGQVRVMSEKLRGHTLESITGTLI